MYLLKYAEILFSRVELLQKPSDICNRDIKSFEQLGVNIK
jgi:hypothetical protein